MDIDGFEVLSVQDVWITESNEDLTEGRGTQFPLFLSNNEITAYRLGHKNYVQGSDCPVKKSIAIRATYNGQTHVFAPARIHRASQEDEINLKKLKKRNEALMKLKDLGLNEIEVKELVNSLDGK